MLEHKMDVNEQK